MKNQLHIHQNGIKVKTVSIDPAVIEVKVEHTGGNPRVKIFDCDENEIATTSTVSTDCICIHIPDAKLWDTEHPDLYTCKVELTEQEIIKDTEEVKFGIRELKWSQKGFFVNNQETLLRGGCIHHDNGILGACAFEEAEWRKVRIMKEQGFNAIRSSHNPCSKAMLDACDALGMYMMDEAWDMWYRHKSKYDYAERFDENYKNDLQQMIEKDYNHPSVIMYSIGNEVSEPVEEKGAGLEKKIVELV
ncbi:MAG: glycoside hydrolase family 2 TIM barrel-domain containing protein [Eubacteriales bacterium]|nr:glycoside hydrolase family 2 TIM barrel-domain containing protein [Eubacteriales bacterium]